MKKNTKYFAYIVLFIFLFSNSAFLRAENSINIKFSPSSKCDTIILKNGQKIIAYIDNNIFISKIKFRKTEDYENILTIPKKEVAQINYSTGKTKIISKELKRQRREQRRNNSKYDIFAFLSLLFSIASIFSIAFDSYYIMYLSILPGIVFSIASLVRTVFKPKKGEFIALIAIAFSFLQLLLLLFHFILFNILI